MPIQLSVEREELVRSLVKRGRYATADEVVDAALLLLARSEDIEQARVLEGLRQGIADRDAGRGRPADDVFADIRREFQFPADA